ncbi:MAG: TerB family tellurite resistance protein [Polyangiaceae bacterium]|nr:TerB family tellurite resistance protein [Polyangiaceae bacterium]
MDPRETYLRLMVCVARADGQIVDPERQLLQAAVGRSGLAESQVAGLRAALETSHPFDIEEELERVGPGIDPGTLLELLRDGYVLAYSDGELAPTEVAVLDKSMSKLGIQDVDRSSLHEWGRLAADHVIDGLHAASTALEHDASGQ